MKFSKNCFVKIAFLGFACIFSANNLIWGMENSSSSSSAPSISTLLIDISDSSGSLKEAFRLKLPNVKEKAFKECIVYKLSSQSKPFVDLKEAYEKLREQYGENTLLSKELTKEHGRISLGISKLFYFFENIATARTLNYDQNPIKETIEPLNENIYFFATKSFGSKEFEKFYCLMLGDLIDYDAFIIKRLAASSCLGILRIAAKMMLKKCCCCFCCCCKND
jgi:hypothetical protein